MSVGKITAEWSAEFIDIMIEPFNWLTFDGDLVWRRIPDHFSTSVTITDYDILGDLLAFLIESPAACHETERNKCSRQENEVTIF